ncbi:MAG: AMP-binding protein [Halioglobus sp.]
MAAASFGAMTAVLAADAAQATALVCDTPEGVQSLTRSELDQRSNQLARAYAQRGLGAGDIATLALPNGLDFFLSCFAIWKLGAIPNPLSPLLPKHERDAIIARAQPTLVIGVAPDDCAYPCIDTRPALDSFSTQPLPDRVSPRERALASGGSTGVPKLIVAANPALYDPDTASPLFRGEQAVLVPGPLYHGAPFSAAFQGLFAGCKLVVMHRFDAERCLALIEEHRVDRMTVVPTMMQRIWKLPTAVRERYDVSSLAFVLTGSAPCPPWLMRAWIDWLGPEVMHEAFGPSERIGGTFISGSEWLQHPGSVGRPAAGAQLKILDDDGRELPPGEMGEIFVMPAGGPGSTFHYVGAQPKLSEDGWQSVGDMGYFDEEGYLYLGDRRSDMILVDGRNVYPAEVEAAIDAFEGVRSSAVIGLPRGGLGERLHAIIDVGPAAQRVSEQAFRDHLEQRLVHYKLPATIEWVNTALRDDAGKMRRTALRAERLDASK